jgi:hypothetical protein
VSGAPGELDPAIARRIRRIVEFPVELLEYVTWLRQGVHDQVADDYLFEKPAVRFEPRGEDVLLADPTLRVESQGNTTVLVSTRSPAPLTLTQVSAAGARALLAACDGERTLAEVRMLADTRQRELEQLLAQAFGKMLFAPLALQELERVVSGAEVSRFPGSPYEIARPYWSNMASIRRALAGFEGELVDTERFVARLEELHVVALMGADLQSFYRPRSPISQRRAAPGQLMHTRPSWLRGASETVFLSGPRVNAAFIGGRTYHELLYDSLGEPEAAELRAHGDARGISWGTLLRARAEHDPSAEDWFCPPRPFQAEHFAALRVSLLDATEAAARGDHARAIERLAHFHQSFIRLHPFHCANQCLVMSIVNWLLGRVLGSGIPHLMLDHLALRLSSSGYARVFARAVEAYAQPGKEPAQRYLDLTQKRARAFALLHEISTCNGMTEARRRSDAARDIARLLLLRPLAGEPHAHAAAS